MFVGSGCGCRRTLSQEEDVAVSLSVGGGCSYWEDTVLEGVTVCVPVRRR